MSNVTSSTSTVNDAVYVRANELLGRARQTLERLPDKLLRIALSELEESVGVLEVIGRLAEEPTADEASAGIHAGPLHVWRPEDWGLGDIQFLTSCIGFMEREGYKIVRMPEEGTGLVTTLSLDVPLGARELRGLLLEFVQSQRPRPASC